MPADTIQVVLGELAEIMLPDGATVLAPAALAAALSPPPYVDLARDALARPDWPPISTLRLSQGASATWRGTGPSLLLAGTCDAGQRRRGLARPLDHLAALERKSPRGGADRGAKPDLNARQSHPRVAGSCRAGVHDAQ
jgi:hypothetical protein